MKKKYQIIYADPPWSFNNKNTGGSLKSGASHKYKTLTIKDLVESWGFKIKTMTAFNWVKLTKKGKKHFGMGFWTRAGSECCLIAVKGKTKPVNRSIRSVIEAKVEAHSKKPDIFADRIVELCGDLPRIELFARDKKRGWDVWGNEV